jgi:LPXTG-site transpeptidase (sortase) family protein
VRPELPVRLRIPQIGVDTTFEYVGLTTEGAMDAPKGPDHVAWFNLGPRPGETGSAIVAGHYGWKNSIPAVFDNLGKLQKGDKFSIQDKQGVITTFAVQEVRAFGEHDDASSVFGSRDDGAHLNLITCGGIWNATTKSYSNRLVVFSDKE